MKRLEKISASWLGYIDRIRDHAVSADMPLLTDVQQLLNTAYLPSIFHYCIPMMYIVDYTQGSYMIVSDSASKVFGFSPKKFTEGGLEFTIDSYHPDDLKLFNDQIFPDRIKTLKEIVPAEHQNHIFTFNYRMKNAAGDYNTLLQRNSFISDVRGNPLISIGMVVNIQHFGQNSPVVQVLENKGTANPGEMCLVEKKTYYLHEEDKMFTKREKEILCRVAEGLTSKEIADKMFLSESTVINHRKNMLSKSSTKNVTELVALAIRNGVI